MFDDFSLCQKVAYNILRKSILKGTYSHAYLINTNGYSKGFDFVKALSKSILCPQNFLNNDNCNMCGQCNLIDNDSFPEFKVIDCDGLWIKKEQTDNLQTEFSKKSVNSSRKVYIINNVDNVTIDGKNYNDVVYGQYDIDNSNWPLIDSIAYGDKTYYHGSGLTDYNWSGFLWIQKGSSSAPHGAEWKCITNHCQGKTYSEDKTDYVSTDFCNSNYDDCSVVLSVNW